MATYQYRCPEGHVTEEQRSMTEEIPPTIQCGECFRIGTRIFTPPAAIHFKGPGFYETDVRQKLHRKRRKGPADDLQRPHDPVAAKIADAI